MRHIAGNFRLYGQPTMKMLVRLFLICYVLVGLSLGVAQNNAPAGPEKSVSKEKPTAAAAKADEGKKPEAERVIIEHADLLRRDAARKLYQLRGNVVFARRDMKMYCDEAEYNEETDTAVARGHLRITDPNTVITGDLLEVDFGKEIAVVTGNVTIITQKKGNKPTATAAVTQEKPLKSAPRAQEAAGQKPSPPSNGAQKPKRASREPERLEEYWEKKTVITCERVEYHYADNVKKIIATPRVKAVQEDKTVWADTVIYEDIPRQLTLTGNVILQTDKGDEMRCLKVVVSLDEDWLEAEGASIVTFRRKKTEEKPAPSSSPPAGESASPAAAGKSP